MGQAGAIVVAPGRQKDLRLMLQTPERLAVQDPVPIPLIDRPDIAGRLISIPPPGISAQGSIRT